MRTPDDVADVYKRSGGRASEPTGEGFKQFPPLRDTDAE